MRGSVVAVMGVALLLFACGIDDAEVPPTNSDTRDTDDLSISQADTDACSSAGEALSAFEAAGADRVSGSEAQRRGSRLVDAFRGVGMAGSEASTMQVRDAGIEASRTFRAGDLETAVLHLRAMATACENAGIEVEIAAPGDGEEPITAEGEVCKVVEDIDPDFEKDSLESSERGRMNSVFASERSYLDRNSEIGRLVAEWRGTGYFGQDEIFVRLQAACRSVL